jgi:diguanylate cyclase (GGDEF)-like protein/PAS domain S-box-containing protein
MTVSATNLEVVSNLSALAAYKDLFERLLDCVLLLDPSTHVILEANPACERIFGVPSDELIHQPIYRFVQESHHAELSKALRIAMRRYHPRQFEMEFALQSLHMMEVQACPLLLSNKQEVLQIIARDINDRIEAQREMQALLQQLQTKNSELATLTTVDEMTGLFNFRHFKSALATEHARATRFDAPYAVIFCDIDHFKKFNDQNGHPEGDLLLKSFAKILQNACRNSDTPVRYGGEEFVVICPGVTWEGAMILAERIRKQTEETAFPHGDKQPLGRLTVSIGVASFPQDGTTPDLVIQAADQALYRSKHAGRNRVTAHSKP